MADPGSIDHLVVAGPDLAQLTSWWSARTGSSPTPGGSHPGRGTANCLVGVDSTTYIELIGPDPAQVEVEGGRLFGVDDLESAALLTFALAVPDIDVAIDIAGDVGVGYGPVSAMSRKTPSGTTLSWRLAFPDPEWDGVMPFLIEWGDHSDHPAANLSSGADLLAVMLRHPRPDPIRAAIARISGVEIAVDTGDARVAARLRIGEAIIDLPQDLP